MLAVQLTSSVWQINWEDRVWIVLELGTKSLEDTMEPMVWQDIFPILSLLPKFLFISQEGKNEGMSGHHFHGRIPGERNNIRQLILM